MQADSAPGSVLREVIGDPWEEECAPWAWLSVDLSFDHICPLTYSHPGLWHKYQFIRFICFVPAERSGSQQPRWVLFFTQNTAPDWRLDWRLDWSLGAIL